MQQCIKIYYSIFIQGGPKVGIQYIVYSIITVYLLLAHPVLSSTCFGRHTAHHQEPKTALAASGLHMWKVVGRVVAGRCQAEALCPTASSNHTSNNLLHMQTRGCWCSFRRLMMGGMSPETCWASYKYWIINVDTLLHLVGFFCMNCSPYFFQTVRCN